MRADNNPVRFPVDVVIANARDVVIARPADRVPESVPHRTISAMVGTGTMRLVIPQSLVDPLDLIIDGETTLLYADHRRATRTVVSNVWLQFMGRHGVFSAVVEPDRPDALLGAIVLEELDLIVDCITQSLHPREPDRILTEIE